MADLKNDVQGAHLLDGSLYNSATETDGVDLASWDQVKLDLVVTAVATDLCTVRIQDSADGVTWANTSFQTSLAAGIDAGTYPIWVRARDVRRFVRVRLVPVGTITLAVSANLLGPISPPAATTYIIDTSA